MTDQPDEPIFDGEQPTEQPAPKKVVGRPFVKGDPRCGRKKGSRNAEQQLVADMLGENAGLLTQKAIDMALAGNEIALKVCIDRLLPILKERRIKLGLPPINTAEDFPAATQCVLDAIAEGEIGPGEAATLAVSIDSHRRSLESASLEKRISDIESKLADKESES